MKIDVDSYLDGKKSGRADKVLQLLFFLFSDDIQYRSEESLVSLVEGLFDLVETSFKFQALNTFYNRKKESFQHKVSKQGRESILFWIYNNMLTLEGLGPLHGFGFTDVWGDRLWGNPEYQSIYEVVPGVIRKEN